MRHCYQGTFKDQNGAVVGSSTTSDGTSGTITVYLAGTNTLASVYTASSGGVAVNFVNTDAYGHFYFWVDDAVYSYDQLFKIVLTHSDFEARTYDNIEIVRLTTTGINTLIENKTYTVDGTGAIPRTATTRFKDFISVREFNVTGDIDQDPADVLAGLTAAWAAHRAIYAPKGIYTLEDEFALVTGTFGVNNYQGGRSLMGDGYYTVLRQTGTNKHVLALRAFWHPDDVAFFLAGITIKDMTLIGEAGTYDALRLEGVINSHFDNLTLCSARYCQYEAGTMSNSFVNIRGSKNVLDIQPISGVTPVAPENGLRIEVGPSYFGVLSQYGSNTSHYINCSYEGCSSDGIVASAWHGASGDIISEANGGAGAYLVEDCLHNNLKFWFERNSTYDLYSKDGFRNTFDVLCASDGPVIFDGAINDKITGHVGNITISAGCSDIILEDFKYSGSMTDGTTTTIKRNVRTGALRVAGTQVTPYRTGTASPQSSITPNYIGEIFLDTTAKVSYMALGAVNTDWKALNS